MFLRDPGDFHYIAVCLRYRLATPAEIGQVVKKLEGRRDSTLGELLVEEGILSQAQFDAVAQQLVHNRVVERLMTGQGAELAAPAPTSFEAMETVRVDEETLLLNEDGAMGTRDTFELSQTAIEPDPIIADSVYSSSQSGHQTASGTVRTRTFTATLLGRQYKLEDLLGTEIAGHTIEGTFGKGAFGQVFKVRQKSLNRLVALKVLSPKVVGGEGAVARFIDEAQTLASFSHPNIVQVYDVGSEDGVYYFTMEAVIGQSLRELMDSQGRVPVAVAVNMLKQCLRGLERAARAGVIHRDIKPGNLMIDDNGIVKLADFGIAARVSSGGSFASTSLVGTPLYVSPEQITGQDITSQADQYSLGATFYHLMTGVPPFNAPNLKDLLEKHVNEPPPDACLLAPEIQTELSQVLQRMMAKKPTDRYEDFQKIYRLLEDFELRQGLIESRSTFLAEGLIDIGEKSVRQLQRKVVTGISTGVLATLAAIGISEALERTGHGNWKTPVGNMGGLLLVLSFAAIMYIAGVRKRWLPALGNVRTWLQAHIVMALAGFILSMVHSGNFLRFFMSPRMVQVPGHGASPQVVSLVPFLNSLLFTAVVTSGLVGRYLWRDIANQVAADRIARGIPEGDVETHELTLSIFAQRSLRYWRIFHYPAAFALIVVTFLHVVSIYYYGGR